MVNATGWSELMNGRMIDAVFIMYDLAWAGWTVAILFFVFQFMLYLKSRNMTLCWITGLMFLSLYVGLNTLNATNLIRMESINIMFIMLVLELAGIMFVWLFK